MKVQITAQATVEVSPADYALLAGAKPDALVQALARADVLAASITGIEETPAELKAREERERLNEELALLMDENEYVEGNLEKEPEEPVIDAPTENG